MAPDRPGRRRPGRRGDRGRARRLAGAPSMLVAATLEDALALRRRPNLPGTTDERPNWSPSLPLPLADVFARPPGPGWSTSPLAALSTARGCVGSGLGQDVAHSSSWTWVKSSYQVPTARKPGGVAGTRRDPDRSATAAARPRARPPARRPPAPRAAGAARRRPPPAWWRRWPCRRRPGPRSGPRAAAAALPAPARRARSAAWRRARALDVSSVSPRRRSRRG